MSVLVTKPAPEFTAEAVFADGSFGKVSLSQFKGKHVVLFFYPLDFTFVCPTEIIAFDHRIEEFKARGVEVLGVSVDSKFSHWAWRNTKVKDGGIGQIGYTLVSDLSKKIGTDYDVLIGGEVALRASFLIDKEGIVQHQVVNALPIGRNIDEMLRTIDALQFSEEHGEVCPAGWEKGKSAFKAGAEGVAEYLSKNAKKL